MRDAGPNRACSDLLKEKDVLLARVRRLVERDVAEFNRLAQARGAAPITVAPPRAARTL